jgi:hypothetical protein
VLVDELRNPKKFSAALGPEAMHHKYQELFLATVELFNSFEF